MDRKTTITALLLVLVASSVLAVGGVQNASADAEEDPPEAPEPEAKYESCGGLSGCRAGCGCGCGGNPNNCGCGR